MGRAKNQTFALLLLLRMAENKYRVFLGFGNEKASIPKAVSTAGPEPHSF
jgi:hypothetical protein